MAIEPQCLTWAESIVGPVAESTGYRLNKRQVQALAILDDAHLRIRSTFKVRDDATVFRSALNNFLRGAKLVPPFNIRSGVNEVVRSAASAYRSALGWEQAVESGDTKAAGHYAYQVCDFVYGLHYMSLTPYLLRDELRQQRSRNIARKNRAEPAKRHAEWLRIAREVLVDDDGGFLKSMTEVCRRVSRRAAKNPIGRPYSPRVIFNAIGHRLTTRRKSRE